MDKELIQAKLNEILNQAYKINFKEELKGEFHTIFNDIELYILNDALKEEVLQLEEEVITETKPIDEKKNYKGKAFFEFAKIINPQYPAFKYSFYVAKKPVEIFDRQKVKDAIPAESIRWKNIELKRLEDEIASHTPFFTQQEVNRLRSDLNDKIAINQKKVEEVLENWNQYDVAITTHAYCKTYPALYYTLDTSSDFKGDNKEEKRKFYKKKDTHLRSKAPNLLWFRDDRLFSELRANDKINRILQTHTPYCGTIYIKKIK